MDRFNDAERTPHILSCGHTYCAVCLALLLKDFTIVCPQDRAAMCSISAVSSLAKNFALLDIVRAAPAGLPSNTPQPEEIPWSVEITDGCNNVWTFVKSVSGCVANYQPITPLESSSGCYDGGSPIQNFAVEATLTTMLLEELARTVQQPESRAKGRWKGVAIIDRQQGFEGEKVTLITMQGMLGLSTVFSRIKQLERRPPLELMTRLRASQSRKRQVCSRL